DHQRCIVVEVVGAKLLHFLEYDRSQLSRIAPAIPSQARLKSLLAKLFARSIARFSYTISKKHEPVAFVELDLALREPGLGKRANNAATVIQTNAFTVASHQERWIVTRVSERHRAIRNVEIAVETAHKFSQWRVTTHQSIQLLAQLARRNRF